jgi:hypothetical protein
VSGFYQLSLEPVVTKDDLADELVTAIANQRMSVGKLEIAENVPLNIVAWNCIRFGSYHKAAKRIATVLKFVAWNHNGLRGTAATSQ